ncbi:Uncharacterized protein FKW44_010141 [Caligus rogercresseyi]|uniref:Beta/gamma crystallin 'Greek key' domain-containing protein n=1 Tax=Caligus rogercresseyi TaxID=217165 RepID=A0A7T8HGK0_CALRO|nr:Uncharacterized protein FKW44_010141 [Caligus rogercresseyi]
MEVGGRGVFLVFLFTLYSQKGIVHSASINSCQDLLGIIDEFSLSNFPVFFFEDHPKVKRAIEICRVLRGDTGNQNKEDISLEEEALLEAMKSFENASSRPCTLISYKGQNMRKVLKKISKSVSASRKLRSARSLKVIGPCSWTLYKRRNFKGDNLILEGDREYAKPSDWGWIPGQIRSIKLNAS